MGKLIQGEQLKERVLPCEVVQHRNRQPKTLQIGEFLREDVYTDWSDCKFEAKKSSPIKVSFIDKVEF
ncbi:hypothetical protein swp_0866 [Shewanella piezotolerans WP3]|uniref:Uncharacterized protein n=1 Tax=Shewanella piezotolerans (strain WP3 / JCM 13877) TaxID=225849 RepID=B8CJX2_SHEPW|nr:hypothetical protein swp_0866 [Shewanella piezotolerans WP3]